MAREQFPLVLAWAITHWKAQGMTLPRARVILGARTAGSHGVAFVAVTRVGHRGRLVFEHDLPDWEVFQGVRETPTFRRRVRYELRLQAKASHTIRKYGFCEAEGEQWSGADSGRAAALLENLRVEREQQRARLRQLGRRTDADAFLWPEGEPDYGRLLATAGVELSGAAGDADGAERRAFQEVEGRLLNELHLPAVKEALGALIPEDLHPWQDDPKRRGKKGAVPAERVGVTLQANGWGVSVFTEEKLREHRPMEKGTLEFFLILARQVCQRLNVRVAIGSIGVGERLTGSASRQEGVEEVRREFERGMSSWSALRHEAQLARFLLLPVPLFDGRNCREWMLLTMSSAVEGETLGGAGSFQVGVADRCGRTQTAGRVAKLLEGLLCGVAGRGAGGSVSVVSEKFPVNATSLDTTLAVLGLVWARVGGEFGVGCLNPESSEYLADLRNVHLQAFTRFRAAADARGDRAVENEFKTREACVEFLELMGTRVLVPAPTGGGEVAGVRTGARAAAPARVPGELAALRVLSWNIAGEDRSVVAPATWSVRDKMLALRSEVARLRPEVLALQESPGLGVSDAAPAGLKLIGSAGAHAVGCSVQLYSRPDLRMERVLLPAGAPAVAGRCVMAGVEVVFVSAHLAPHEVNEVERARQLRQITSVRGRGALVLLGDLNVRQEEARDLLDEHGLWDMAYSGRSWAPKVNRFYENLLSIAI